MTGLIARLQAEDPSFDPLALALAASGVSREQFVAAHDRVTADGYFGPINDAEWLEQDGREPASVREALKVLSQVNDEVSDYWIEVMTECMDNEDRCEDDFENCPGHLIREKWAESNDISKDLFREVIEIYGSLPF